MTSNGNEANDSNFSSPMPAVGLDIAGATLTEVIGHFKNGGCVGDFLDCGHGIVDKYLLKIVCHEVYEIINIIGEQRVLDSTISNATNAHAEKLYNDIEELFVELLHSVMDQLPDVIFESLNDNVPFVEFEENVKTSMELVARLNPLEVEPWWFKLDNIYSFMAPEVLLVQKDDKSCDNVSLVITGDHVDFN
ncbi:hypothetical protein Syun_031526 [Stephania yunnanensis]|uniref:Uncharacterized protein n=1 Tax=Stephania yunnanensis TaxID=152371 RepID=A0AAP0HF16_9MAGN